MILDDYIVQFEAEINCIYMNLRMMENWFDNDEHESIKAENFILKFETIAEKCDKALDISNIIEMLINTSAAFFTNMQLRISEIYSCAKIALKSLIQPIDNNDYNYYDDLVQILLKWIKQVKEYSKEII